MYTRGRFAGGMLIDRAQFGNVGVYVGDSDQNLHIAVWQSFRNFDLIEIARCVVVDRRPEPIAEIAHTSSRSNLRRMSTQVCQLLLNRSWKVGLKAMQPHYFFCDSL